MYRLLFLMVGMALCIIIFLALTYIKVPPNEALIISGLRKNKNTRRSRIIVGGAALRLPFFERVDRLSLNVTQLSIITKPPITTTDYIDVIVESVASIKIKSDADSLTKAAEKFLGVQTEDKLTIVRQTIESTIREIVGAMKVSELVSNKDYITQNILTKASKNLQEMGMEIIDFSILRFCDDNNIIASLGAINIAKFSNEAQSVKAESEKEAIIKRAIAKREANEVVSRTEIAMAEQNQSIELKKAELKKLQDTKKAEADSAYKIEEQEQRKALEAASVSADIVKREKEIELRDKEIKLAEQALEVQVRKQAEADKYKIQQLAEAELFERIKKAEAMKAEKIMEAEAEKEAMLLKAEGIEKTGLAEAKAIEAKAEAQKKMGEASVVEMYFKILPELVKNASEPLSKTEKIIMYGEGNGEKIVKDTTKIINQVIEGLGEGLGINFKEILKGSIKNKEEGKEDE